MFLNYTVKKEDTFANVNQVLKNHFHISSKLFYKLIQNNKILLNNKIVDTRLPVNHNDTITVLLDMEEDNCNILPTKMKLNIIFEDDALLIVDKPSGIAVHPSILHYEDSLCNGIKFYFDSINLHKKIRPVNRLDFNTSGIVIFAKNEYVQETLIKQMQNGVFHKEYLAIVYGTFTEKHSFIDAPIARKDNTIIERCVGKPSVTEYSVLKEFNNMSLVLCKLHTGRTHQIRVHMAYIGHPLIGDSLYGSHSELISRQALHSYKVNFIHPVTNSIVKFYSKLPDDIAKLLSSTKI